MLCWIIHKKVFFIEKLHQKPQPGTLNYMFTHKKPPADYHNKQINSKTNFHVPPSLKELSSFALLKPGACVVHNSLAALLRSLQPKDGGDQIWAAWTAAKSSIFLSFLLSDPPKAPRLPLNCFYQTGNLSQATLMQVTWQESFVEGLLSDSKATGLTERTQVPVLFFLPYLGNCRQFTESGRSSDLLSSIPK